MALIDQQEAIDALNTQAEEMSHWDKRWEEQRKGILTAVRIVSDIKPKQEIIHCKDCKHWKEKPLYTYCERMYHMGFAEVFDYTVEENDFCSWADRKGEADGINNVSLC